MTGIAEAMWRHVNEWPEKPCRIGLDALGKEPPSMMLQQLSGTVTEKRFVDGGFIGRWPFGVSVRVGAKATGERLEAVAVLGALAKWLTGAALPDIGAGRRALRIEMAALPAQAAAYPDGTEDYQAIFALAYKEEANADG